jgi:hypothetical protein
LHLAEDVGQTVRAGGDHGLPSDVVDLPACAQLSRRRLPRGATKSSPSFAPDASPEPPPMGPTGSLRKYSVSSRVR